MTKLSDLMNPYDLAHELEAGFVRMRQHPHDEGLFILNYTEKAQYDKHWNDVTRQCRGLIARTDETGEDAVVLARPFDKFFNYGEYEEGILNLDAAVDVTDKMDGSLGILYPGPDGWAIATRGSFESEQAIHATKLLREKYPDFAPLSTSVTYLFEIVYPENRIVLDYGDADDLFLLGLRNNATGQITPANMPWVWNWEGPTTQSMPYSTLAEALAAPPRKNAEGLVVRFSWSNQMVKVKQEDYVRLHKLVTGLNERAVWEHLSQHGGAYGQLLASVPDEFHQWVTQVADGFLDDYESLQGWAHVEFQKIREIVSVEDYLDPTDRETRARFAREARERTLSGLLFQMLDGRDIGPAIWKHLKPKGETSSLMNRNEDNA
jgi:RNA ligase